MSLALKIVIGFFGLRAMGGLHGVSRDRVAAMSDVDREELERHWVPARDKRRRVVRRLGLALGAILVLAGLSVPTGAVPMARIVGFQVRVYNYADQRYTNCRGSGLEPKVRLQPLVFGSAAPFTVKLEIDKRFRQSGNFHWRLEEQYTWAYQHIPADAASLRFQAAYSEHGVTSSVLDPGFYRLSARVWGDASGAAFIRRCRFKIEG
jgi:hypothetical protein